MTGTRWRKTVVVLIAVALVATGCGGDGDSEEAGSPAEPTAGTWKTWVLSSPTDIPVPPPPGKGSAQEKAEDQEIKDLATSARRR
jgi:ABC-type glycerol-3-phosphate transport system substrate-binding protein